MLKLENRLLFVKTKLAEIHRGGEVCSLRNGQNQEET